MTVEQEPLKGNRSMTNGTNGHAKAAAPPPPTEDDFVAKWESYVLGKLVFVSDTVRRLPTGQLESSQAFGNAMFQATDQVRLLLRQLYRSAVPGARRTDAVPDPAPTPKRT